jgi:hypothetical protein
MGELEYDATHQNSWRWVRDFLIRAYPREHNATLSKVMFKKPEYCAACHKQFVDEEVNKVGWVQLQNQYDNWRMSKWARHPKDPRRTTECRECHMPLVRSHDPAAGDPYDYNRMPNDGMHRSHRFIAANQLMPALLKLKGADEQTRLTHQWLKGDFPIPEIEKKWHKPGVPAVAIHLDAPAAVRPGEPVHVQCLLTSNKVGHDFPTGPLDIIQSWLEVVVKDEQGRVVYTSGTVNKKGFIQPGSFMFKAEPVDQYGNLIDRHNLWEMVGVRFRRALFPGYSDTVNFSIPCSGALAHASNAPPATAGTGSLTIPCPDVPAPAESGEYRIAVALKYRKVDQFLLNYLFGETNQLTAPVTEIARATALVKVRPKAAADHRPLAGALAKNAPEVK